MVVKYLAIHGVSAPSMIVQKYHIVLHYRIVMRWYIHDGNAAAVWCNVCYLLCGSAVDIEIA